MYIEELKNGKFKYIQSYKDLKGNTKRISVTKNNKTRATQKAALEELNQRINDTIGWIGIQDFINALVKFF